MTGAPQGGSPVGVGHLADGEAGLDCQACAGELPGVVDGAAFSPAVDRHVARCLRCQAEVAGYRRLRRGLRRLAEQPVSVPEDLMASVHWLAGGQPVRAPERRRGTRVVAATGGLVGVVGLALWAARARRSVGLVG